MKRFNKIFSLLAVLTITRVFAMENEVIGEKSKSGKTKFENLPDEIQFRIFYDEIMSNKIGDIPKAYENLSLTNKKFRKIISSYKNSKLVEPLKKLVSQIYKFKKLFTVDFDTNIDSTDAYDYTALSNAAAQGYFELAEFLISKGADINYAKKYGTALMRAAMYDNPSMATFLIKNGANVNYRDEEGNQHYIMQH